LPIGLVRFLPTSTDATERGELVNSSLTLGALMAAVFGAVFLIGGRAWVPSTVTVLSGPWAMLAFVLLGVLFALSPIIDSVAIAHRRVKYLVGWNFIYNCLRVSLLAIFTGVLSSFGLILALLAAQVGATIAALFLFFPLVIPGYRPVLVFGREQIRPLLRFSIGNHVAKFVGGLGPSLLPALILLTRSPNESAWFYIAWMLGSSLYLVPSAFSTSLFAEASQAQTNVKQDVRRTVLAASLLLIPSAFFLHYFGHIMLALFGESYAAGGTPLLRWMVLAAPFVLINGVYLTLWRVQKRVGAPVSAAAFTSISILGGSWALLTNWGLWGVGVAWFSTQAALSGILLANRFARIGGRGPSPYPHA